MWCILFSCTQTYVTTVLSWGVGGKIDSWDFAPASKYFWNILYMHQLKRANLSVNSNCEQKVFEYDCVTLYAFRSVRPSAFPIFFKSKNLLSFFFYLVIIVR